MSVVIRAVEVIGIVAGVCVACSALFLGWCVLAAAADRRRARRQPAPGEPEVDDAVAMVKAWKAAPAVRTAPRNIPRGDGAFHGDGLAEALEQIRKEGKDA